MKKKIKTLCLALLAAPLLSTYAGSVVLATKDDALGKAFPPAASIERRTVFLTDGEAKKAGEIAGAKMEYRVFTYYRAAAGDGRTQGYAVIENLLVRTKKAVMMTVIKPGRVVDKVEVLAFYEPREYMPSGRWLGLFSGKTLSSGLRVNRDIAAVSGATMSSYAFAAQARLALAVFEVKGIGGAE